MGTGKFMLRITLASSRVMRAGAFGLAAIAAVVFSTDHADARRYRHHHRHHHHEARHSYNPPFASIVVDANSGATLASNSPDSIRHPASLTKMMTLYLLFERLDAGKIVSTQRCGSRSTRLNRIRPSSVCGRVRPSAPKTPSRAGNKIRERCGGRDRRGESAATRMTSPG